MKNYNILKPKRMGEALVVAATAVVALNGCSLESNDDKRPLATHSITPTEIANLDTAAKTRTLESIAAARKLLEDASPEDTAFSLVEADKRGYSIYIDEDQADINEKDGSELVVSSNMGVHIEQRIGTQGTEVEVQLIDNSYCVEPGKDADVISSDEGCPVDIYDDERVWLTFTNPSQGFDRQITTDKDLKKFFADEDTHLSGAESTAGIAREAFEIDHESGKISTVLAESTPLGDVYGEGNPTKSQVIAELDAVVNDAVTQTHLG